MLVIELKTDKTDLVAPSIRPVA